MSENDKSSLLEFIIFKIDYFEQEDIMFEKLNSLFVLSTEKPTSVKASENAPEETKKCKKCLRRVALKYERCPYCRSGDFHFDDN